MNGRESVMTTVITCHSCKSPGINGKIAIGCLKSRMSRVIWRTTQENNIHNINLTTARTRIAISSSLSQQIAVIRKYGARITKGEASAITREMIAEALPLTVKVQKMRRSLWTVM